VKPNQIEVTPADIDPLNPDDPKDINGRLYDAISNLLDKFEEMTVREQVAVVSAIARIQVQFPKIRETSGDSRRGAVVRQYTQAFKANAGRRRKSAPRSTIPDDDLDDGFDELEQ
jgi:hypothetical protein